MTLTIHVPYVNLTNVHNAIMQAIEFHFKLGSLMFIWHMQYDVFWFYAYLFELVWALGGFMLIWHILH
jgi:hypothetical protein